MKTEIEKRCYLDEESKQRILHLSKKTDCSINSYEQLSIHIEFDDGMKISIKNMTSSVNICFVNKNNSPIRSFLKIKKGNVSQIERMESLLSFDPEEYINIVDLLNFFGLDKGCPRFVLRTDIKFGNLKISFKERGLPPDHLEIEIKEGGSEKEIDLFIKENNLTIIPDDIYIKHMEKTFSDHPPVYLNSINWKSYF